MRILITGICGFVGSSLAKEFRRFSSQASISGIDNLIRPGSETSRQALRAIDVEVFHGDVRLASDFESLPEVDWVIDAAANPSVLAGVDGKTSSRQLVEHNLSGTLNMLEYVRRCRAGFLLLSTSRVYSIAALAKLPLVEKNQAFTLDAAAALPAGCSCRGIAEAFSTSAPISLYGATKLASEVLALEYGSTFNLPVIVNRCGVLAGAGQFGTAEQGIFSYWIRAYACRRPLRYIGFQGKGYQVRDALHPTDLAQLVWKQMQAAPAASNAGCGLWNVAGGVEQAMSLAQLSEWCAGQFGRHDVQADLTPRPFDIPWVVMDSAKVQQAFGWKPQVGLAGILEEIARHHRQYPNWLDLSQR